MVTLPRDKNASGADTEGAAGRLRPVSTSFWRDRFLHELVERSGPIAIYRKSKLPPGALQSCVLADPYVGYEVVKIQTGPPHPQDADRDLWDLVERYPSNEQWGTHGWSCQTLTAAENKAKDLADAAEAKTQK
jgi:hypothetical protein